MTTVCVMKLFPNHTSSAQFAHSVATLSTLQHRKLTMLGVVHTHIFLVIKLSLLFLIAEFRKIHNTKLCNEIHITKLYNKVLN